MPGSNVHADRYTVIIFEQFVIYSIYISKESVNMIKSTHWHVENSVTRNTVPLRFQSEYIAKQYLQYWSDIIPAGQDTLAICYDGEMCVISEYLVPDHPVYQVVVKE